MKKLNNLFLGLAVLLAVGCAKEDKQDDPIPVPEPQTQVQNQAKTCQLVGRDGPSITYVNDASGKIVRTYHKSPGSAINFDQELIYNAAGNISEVRSYNESNVLFAYKIYTYNAHNLPDTIKSYEIIGSGQTIYHNYELFEYNASRQLVKRSMFGPKQTVSGYYSLFSYPGPNQSKELVYSTTGASPSNAVLVATYVNEYDNKKSPYTLLNFYYHSVLVSKHNIISSFQTNHTIGASQTYNTTYEYNDEGYPVKEIITSQSSNSPSTLNWYYNCQ